jgi:hypothetical protein
MSEYIGLDVSLKETSICVRRNGKRVWRGKCVNRHRGLTRPATATSMA